MRLVLLALGIFAVALGLAYAAGRGVRAVREDSGPPVVCPEVTMEERLAGHIVGLAHALGPRFGSILAGIVPGGHGGGPEQLERLTVVEGARLHRVTQFERVLRRERDDRDTSFHLTIPRLALHSDGPSVFVTSACVPDHPVDLRVRAFDRFTPSPPDPVQEARLLAYLREQLPPAAHGVLAPTGSFHPRLRGHVDVALPGCPRLAAIDDRGGALTEHQLFALVCLGDADAVTRTVRAPQVGPRIAELAALDIDGDGTDELLVVRHQPLFASEYVLQSELLRYNPAEDDFATIDLGPLAWQ